MAVTTPPAEELSRARERVLAIAEKLFAAHGLARVTMREVAEAAGMRQASLYHHAPGGKEQLYRWVFERMLERHRNGLDAALRAAKPDLRSRLCAVADWYLLQEPMNFLRMMTSDMPALGEEVAAELSGPAYQALMLPITRAFADAVARGEVRAFDPDLLAGSLLAILDAVALASTRAFSPIPARENAHRMIDVIVTGLQAPGSAG
jgi:AcrR family transcriptional regulator